MFHVVSKHFKTSSHRGVFLSLGSNAARFQVLPWRRWKRMEPDKGRGVCCRRKSSPGAVLWEEHKEQEIED